jgi:phage shock protein PspC (stress-responsive transcriptional regulator)
MNRTDVHGTLREMWETRPARPREDRLVAGVASAIARRYDIDPTLVRIAFVVAAFSGIGAALYIAGWIALPEEQADPADPVKARSPKPIFIVGLVIATLFSIGSVFGDHQGILLPALAVLILLFLLHRSRGTRVAGISASAPAPETPAGPSLLKESPVRETPPAWDPLGAAPFAWDLPEPSPLPERVLPRRRRLPVTAVTLGLALLAGGATALMLLVSGALTLANVPLLLGVGLAVIGSGRVPPQRPRADPNRAAAERSDLGRRLRATGPVAERRVRRHQRRPRDAGRVAAELPARDRRHHAGPAQARPLGRRTAADLGGARRG